MSEKSLDKLLNANSDGHLGGLVRRARETNELLKRLQDALPEEQSGAIAAANLRDDGELVILASSPAWAARLRFDKELLLATARDTGRVASGCTVRVLRDGE